MSAIREVVTIFVGQAGTQISNACWELFCLEHGIEPNGNLKKKCCTTGNLFTSFFSQTQVNYCNKCSNYKNYAYSINHQVNG